MKICPKCGMQVPDQERYCQRCGMDFTQIPQRTSSTQGGVQGFKDLSASAQSQTDQQNWNQANQQGWNQTGQQSWNQTNQQGWNQANQQGWNQTGQQNWNQGYSGYNQRPALNTAGLEQRNIALCIIFSIITIGIYGFYWIAKVNDGVNQAVGDQNATSGGLVVLFSIISLGIYEWYWLYKMGEKVNYMKGGQSGSAHIVYLILGIIGISIIPICLIQDTLNQTIRMQNVNY